MTDAEVSRAICAMRAAGAIIPDTPTMRAIIAALLDAQVNHDVDNTKMPFKLGSRLSDGKRKRSPDGR
jgi:hypothetical protein